MRSVEPDSSPSSSSMGWNFRGLFSNRIWKHSLKKHIITNHNASVAYHDKHVTLAWVCVLTGVQWSSGLLILLLWAPDWRNSSVLGIFLPW